MREKKYHEVGSSNPWRAIRFFGLCGASVVLVLFLCRVAPGLAKEKDIYPTQKINWLIPYKAGGGFDLVARGIAPYLS